MRCCGIEVIESSLKPVLPEVRNGPWQGSHNGLERWMVVEGQESSRRYMVKGKMMFVR